MVRVEGRRERVYAWCIVAWQIYGVGGVSKDFILKKWLLFLLERGTVSSSM
jgi:hypothetical protein